jgi:hypothetical protein
VPQNSGEWWRRVRAIDTRPRQLEGAPVAEWYCFGGSLLVMQSTDVTFSSRFREIYDECAVSSPGDESQSRIKLQVTALPSEPDLLAVSVTPGLPDGVDFVRQLLPGRRYREWTGGEHGWRMLASPEAPDEPVFAFGPSEILVSRAHPWQQTIAMYAISSAFWLQRDLFVFHAASVGLFEKGVLLSGPKGAGKTTLALSFASRGHSFLGDEWAAVSTSSGELLPLRRAASIRPGPHPAGLDEYLREHSGHTEVLPDGEERVRTRVGGAFPRAAAHVVPLTDIFFLRRFSSHPAVEPFARNGEELPPISPLLASVWGHSPAERAFDLLRTLGRARWWHLDVGGSPGETAELVEDTVKEESWL